MSNSSTNEGALWGGRFADKPSHALEAISKSTHFDWRLAPYDIKGSIAHAHALKTAGIITDEDVAVLEKALLSMLDDFEASALIPLQGDEDVHGALERVLIERAGEEVGGKLRAGRSRNDQIATLIRLYMLDATQKLRDEVIGLLESITTQASSALKERCIMPGRTHLQHAQPVLLAHHLLAHGWALLRDLERFEDWSKRAKLSPYGSGALAGQTLGLDATSIAKELGLSGLEPNSIDATSSRDVVAEFAFILTTISINLSRFAEEIILWNTKEFGFVKLSDAYSTGSSIMPQKKNPDISELTRGKSGRIIGNLSGLLATLKGLPLAYNRDLQEDKEPVFDSVDQLLLILPAFSGQVKTMQFNYQRLNDLAPQGFALATDIAEWLVKEGVPFKIAHELSGECVTLCEQKASALNKEVDLWDLSDAEFEEILSPALDRFSSRNDSKTTAKDVRSVLTAIGSVTLRDTFSGTSPERVERQLISFVKKINDLR
ncbi:MAG: argininosuccinate lyase [Candidatus Ancillula sp.]|nr:argininosuccinate lyase [Candidatus Ancillula sp.]